MPEKKPKSKVPVAKTTSKSALKGTSQNSSKSALRGTSKSASGSTPKNALKNPPKAPFKIPRMSGRLFFGLAAVVCLAIAAVLLVPVAGDYYVAKRANDQLEAEYQALVNRNAKIQDQIDSLETPEGIEDRAREEFGWVKEGESAVNITGLETSDSSTVMPNAVSPGSVLPESTWLTNLLDKVFGVEQPTGGFERFDSVEP